jgi:hypothetical protein
MRALTGSFAVNSDGYEVVAHGRRQLRHEVGEDHVKRPGYDLIVLPFERLFPTPRVPNSIADSGSFVIVQRACQNVVERLSV